MVHHTKVQYSEHAPVCLLHSVTFLLNTKKINKQLYYLIQFLSWNLWIKGIQCFLFKSFKPLLNMLNGSLCTNVYFKPFITTLYANLGTFETFKFSLQQPLQLKLTEVSMLKYQLFYLSLHLYVFTNTCCFWPRVYNGILMVYLLVKCSSLFVPLLFQNQIFCILRTINSKTCLIWFSKLSQHGTKSLCNFFRCGHGIASCFANSKQKNEALVVLMSCEILCGDGKMQHILGMLGLFREITRRINLGLVSLIITGQGCCVDQAGVHFAATCHGWKKKKSKKITVNIELESRWS